MDTRLHVHHTKPQVATIEQRKALSTHACVEVTFFQVMVQEVSPEYATGVSAQRIAFGCNDPKECERWLISAGYHPVSKSIKFLLLALLSRI